jgi:hypothetical protein
MAHRRQLPPLILTFGLAMAGVAACTDDPGVDPAGASPQTGVGDSTPAGESSASSESTPEVPTEPSASRSAAEELPSPLGLRAVGGRTIRAEPFADFAVAAGHGVWVTGVSPGAVRYDDATGRVTARLRVDAGVEQALEQSAGSVWIPTTAPELLRVDAVTGEVQERVRLPERPLTEGVVGAIGGTAYVIVDEADPTILVVKRGRVTEEIQAPEGAVAVRAGYGALWVPTGFSTVERYDLRSGEWTSIPSGPGPRFLDVGFGAIWVMDQGDGSVTRIDARTLEPVVLPGSQYYITGGDLTTGGGAVWLRTDDSVVRLHPRTGAATHLIELPPGSGSGAATTRALWITNHDHLAVHVVPLPLPR